MKTSNVILGALIGVALLVAGLRIQMAYVRYAPVAKPGTCLHLQDESGQMVVRVDKNNSDTHSSDVTWTVDLGPITLDGHYNFSYKELRDLHAKEVPCEAN
jgi:hypothetical protein